MSQSLQKMFVFSPAQFALLTVYLIAAIDIFGTTLVIPVLASFTRSLGGEERYVGILFSVFSGCSFISSLYMSRISDIFGRRWTFLLAGFGAFIGFAGSSGVNSFWSLIVWRGVAGLFTGTISNVYAYVVDVVPPHERDLYMNYVTAIISTCFIIGPMIGGGLAEFGLRVPFYAATVMSSIGLMMIVLHVKEPKELMAMKNKKNDDNNEDVNKSAVSNSLSNDNNAAAAKEREYELKQLDKEYQAIGTAFHRQNDNNNNLHTVEQEDDMDLGFQDDTDLEKQSLLKSADTHTQSTTAPTTTSKLFNTPTSSSSSSYGSTTSNIVKGSTTDVPIRTNKSTTATSTSTTSTPYISVKDDEHTIKYPNGYSSPYYHPMAMLIGFLGSFLSQCTFGAFAVLQPLLLMDPKWGIVKHSSSGSGSSSFSSGDNSFGSNTVVGSNSNSFVRNIGAVSNNSGGYVGDIVTSSMSGFSIDVLRRLQEISSGGGSNNNGMIHESDAQKVSLTLGYILALIGIVGLCTQVFLYRRFVDYFGLLLTAAIGNICVGCSFALFLTISSVPMAIPLYIGMAFGNGIARTTFPSYLGSIANRNQVASYVALSSNGQTLAMMLTAQVTLLYATSKTSAFLLAASASIINGIMLTGVVLYTNYQERLEEERKKNAGDAAVQATVLTPLQLFFGKGKGKSESEFWQDLEASLKDTIKERKWTYGLTSKKGQILIKDILLAALPLLPDTFEDRMEALYHKYHEYGHKDWAEGLAGHVDSLQHHLQQGTGCKIPGI